MHSAPQAKLNDFIFHSVCRSPLKCQYCGEFCFKSLLSFVLNFSRFMLMHSIGTPDIFYFKKVIKDAHKGQ